MSRAEFLAQLTAQSTLADVPGHDVALDLGARAKELADLLRARPELPGVLLTRDGRLETAISRRFYLDTVGRYLGMDLYLPRPIEIMMKRFEDLGGALLLDDDLPIQEAVRRGLERRRELIYEPVVARPVKGEGRLGRLVDFEDLLLADSRLTTLRNQQMRQILTTVKEGLLLVGRDHRVASEYSTSVEELLDVRHVAGRSFPDLLGDGLDDERCELARDYVESLFDPRVIEKLVVQINPLLKVVWRRPGAKPRILAVRFARGVDDGVIRRLLVRLEDVTRAEELAAEVEAERQRAERRLTLAVAAVQVEPEILGAFLGALDRLRERAAELARRGGDRAAIEALFRRAHALKGEAGLLKLESFQSALHAIEDELEKGRQIGALDAEGVLRRAAELGELATEARSLVQRISRPDDPATPRREPEPPAEAWTRSLADLVARVAAEQGKQARLVVDAGPELAGVYGPMLREALVQLVRNSVVHGIESPEARRAAGKQETGTVQAVSRLDAASGWVELIVQDDGAGLDLARIRERAGLDAAVEADPRALAEWIFRPGFSTAGAHDLHAGRGFGLDLVREQVEAAGGRVEVYSEPGTLCAFRILLPATVTVPV